MKKSEFLEHLKAAILPYFLGRKKNPGLDYLSFIELAIEAARTEGIFVGENSDKNSVVFAIHFFGRIQSNDPLDQSIAIERAWEYFEAQMKPSVVT